MRATIAAVVVGLGICAAAWGQAKGTPNPGAPVSASIMAKLHAIDTPYYRIYTDVDNDGAKEAWVRMTRMYECYKRRTTGFSGDIRGRWPFYLFKNAEDYRAAGAMPGSAGVFIPFGDARLMAIAGEKLGPQTWHTVQHEGFHQFALGVIGRLPAWLNEGLAEYFGQALFTGDDYVTGIIPPDRLARVQKQIEGGKFRSVKEMMAMSNEEWSGALALANYDMAWSMVHFLAHGDGGKYQKPFSEYVRRVGAGANDMDAWRAVFGPDTAAFGKKWQAWWLAQKPDATLLQCQKAQVMQITGYLARATSQGQTFDTFADLTTAIKEGRVKTYRETGRDGPGDWLPPSMAELTLRNHEKAGTWSLEQLKGQPPKVICLTVEGKKLIGSFKVNGARVASVACDVAEESKGPQTRPDTKK